MGNPIAEYRAQLERFRRCGPIPCRSVPCAEVLWASLTLIAILLPEGEAVTLELRSGKLMAIESRLGESDATQSLRRVEKLTNALAECDKPYFDLPSQALILRGQLSFAIEAWKLRHASRPLIPAERCVGNDAALGGDCRFYIVSGSNMAGKSTLLRSIGLNAVLAKAGAPVRADSLRLTDLEVFASLSIVDSLLEGKSKFLAEVERIGLTLKRAAEAILRTLMESGAIGVLSGCLMSERQLRGHD